MTIQQLLAIKRERRLTDDAIEQELVLRRPVWETLAEGIELSPANDRVKESYRSRLKGLAKSGYLADDATLRDLTDVDWARMRREWKLSGGTWNHLRRMVSLALSNALGDKFHPHRRAVMKKIPTAPTAKFRQGHIDLPIFMDIVKRMPPHSQAGAWVLLLTGLRSGTEYMALGVEHLDHHGHYVSVPGTKTDGSMDRVYVHPSYWSWVIAGTPGAREVQVVGLALERRHGRRVIRSCRSRTSGTCTASFSTGPGHKRVRRTAVDEAHDAVHDVEVHDATEQRPRRGGHW